jgi:Protein of unknown function (DUF2796)
MKNALLALTLVALSSPAFAGKAHEHGVARLDVAVEPQRVVFQLELPLDSLLGFERAPRTDAERKAADAAVARLRAAGELFRIDPAAGCKLDRVDLSSGALGLGGKAASSDGHDDLDASFEFACADAHKAGFAEIGLFSALPKLQRIEVQAVTRKGQMKATLKRPTTRLSLAR